MIERLVHRRIDGYQTSVLLVVPSTQRTPLRITTSMPLAMRNKPACACGSSSSRFRDAGRTSGAPFLKIFATPSLMHCPAGSLNAWQYRTPCAAGLPKVMVNEQGWPPQVLV